jgi:putative ABC transport system permease protein
VETAVGFLELRLGNRRAAESRFATALKSAPTLSAAQAGWALTALAEGREDEAFERLYRTDQRTGTIFRYFAILAIFISCLGIFGLAAFTAEQRTKEIGIRKVLGSSVSGIVSLISREFVMLLTLANLIAWPIAFFLMKRMLNNYAYRTSITVWIFLIAGASAYSIALLTVSYQAFKAARTDPARALRYE